MRAGACADPVCIRHRPGLERVDRPEAGRDDSPGPLRPPWRNSAAAASPSPALAGSPVGHDANVSPGQRTMFLHIGTPKTGTTFLQTALWASRPQLREQGVGLPMKRLEDHIHVAQDVRELYDERERSPQVHGALDRFAAALKRVDTPRALFSMEVVVAATPEQIERFYGTLTDFDVHLVITARDLARQIPAAWQQTLRRRSGGSYERYLSQVLEDPAMTHLVWRSQDVAEVARRWGRSLPPDHVHIVTVPPVGAPQRLLLERFCAVIGVDPGSVATGAAETNPSLNGPQAELLRRVNRALGDRLPDRVAGYNRLAKRYLAMQVLAAQSGPPLQLPTRYADRTRELYERMTQEIRDRGYDVVGDLADLEPTAYGEAGDRGDAHGGPSEAQVAEAGVQAVATMLAQRNEDLRLIRELRQRLRTTPPGGGESWTHRQRRRVVSVTRSPSLLVGRLRRSSRHGRRRE